MTCTGATATRHVSCIRELEKPKKEEAEKRNERKRWR